MGQKIDLTGKRFGKILIIKLVEHSDNRYLWLYKCDCGNYSVSSTSNLNGGKTKSCGCSFYEINKCEKNGQWKDNNVGYGALHSWVKRNLKKPELCECCNKRPVYDLANKGIYNRDFENWEWLCRSCHMKKDGRLDRLHQNNIKYAKV